MAFLTPKATFVHTPKTGGQWVRLALDRAGLLVGSVGVIHSSPDEVAASDEYRSRTFSFAMVRHPLSWYASMWAHRVDEQWEPIDDLDWFTPRWIEAWAEFTAAAKAESFDDYLWQLIDRYPDGFVSTLFDTYTARCTHIGKQEKLEEDLVAILTDIGEDFEEARVRETPERNVRARTRRRQLRLRLSTRLVNAVTEAESRALERFGYDAPPDWLLRGRADSG